jgi:hypothetical protein
MKIKNRGFTRLNIKTKQKKTTMHWLNIYLEYVQSIVSPDDGMVCRNTY